MIGTKVKRMMNQKLIKISNLINYHFKKLWTTDKPYVIAKGGRGSFKSTVISLKLAMMMKYYTSKGETVNIVILRDNSKYLRNSVYKQIQRSLAWLNIKDEYEFRISPLHIFHKKTNSTFYFYGVDDPDKLKSDTTDDVIAVWFEEAANFNSPLDFDQVLPTFIRQKHEGADHVKVFYSYNPPRNPYDWVNAWVDEKRNDPNYFIDHSTYLDDNLGITLPQTLELIETYKQNNFDYYRWLYLGEVVGLGNSIYNMDLFHEINMLPNDDYIKALAYSIDAGHQTSATTCLCLGITGKNNVILLDTYYYSPAGQVRKKSPNELAKDLNDFILDTSEDYPEAPIVQRTIDSAEGGLRNQYFNDYGIRLHGVNKAMKKESMIDYPQDLLAQGRVFILRKKSNDIFISQHQQYRWDEKSLETSEPKVIKENDHTCDAFQYFCMDNKHLLRLKR